MINHFVKEVTTSLQEVRLDRWAVVFHEEERTQPGVEQNNDAEQVMNNPEDQTSMIIMNNYFGIGIDADVCLQFHIKVWNESFHNYKDFLILLLY